MKHEYRLNNDEDVVILNDAARPIYTTYTSGTSEPLYAGDELCDAAESLEMDPADLQTQLMGDGVVCD